MKTTHYVENEELLEEFRKSKKRKEESPDKGPDHWITPKLTRMYMRMVDRIAEGGWYSGNGSNYLMEMKSQALFEFSRYALNFPDKPPHNIFSYYTNMITRAFKRALKKEKTQERIVANLTDQLEPTIIAGYSTSGMLHEIDDSEDEDGYSDV